MSDEHPNPYAFTGTSVSKRQNQENDQSSLVVFWVNVFLVSVAGGFRYLQFTFDDPYTNHVSNIATIFWILAMGAGLVGLIVVGRRFAQKRRVPILVLIWFILVGIYVSSFLASFLKLLFTGV